MFFLMLLILPGVRAQDHARQSHLQRLPLKAVQFLPHKEHVRKGPILFPNDAPPPAPTPLIVTSRPLSESIARSELNPDNRPEAQSQYQQVTYRPNYLTRGNSYEPYSYTLATVTPAYDFDPAKINKERKRIFFKDYERLLAFMHSGKQHRNKRSADLNVNQPSERRRYKQTRKLPIVDEENGKLNNKGSKHAPSAALTTTTDYYDFNEEDNNFDFDFKKFYTNGRKNIETSSSEYLENYSDSKKIRRTQFARLALDEDFQFISSNNLNKISKPRHRLSDRGESGPSDSAEESSDIEEILGFSTTRRSVMRSVKHDSNAVKSVEMNTDNNEMDRREKKPQLRAAKPQYDFDYAQRNTASEVDLSKHKNSPDYYYHSKNKMGEHDNNQESNPSDNYAFSYTVKDHKTGDDFSHSQKSTGSATNGEYRVLLPDGRTQIVSYTADENGYKADVRYDQLHNQENSVDFDYDKDSLGNNDRHKVKQNYGQNQDYIGHKDISYGPQQSLAPYKANVPNYEQRRKGNTNDYEDKNDSNFRYFDVYPTKAAFVDTTANINDRALDGFSDNNNDYLEESNVRLGNSDKVERAKDDYKFSDELDFTKEVVDYSSELDHSYEPHKSKFSTLFNNQNAQEQGQVRPSYNELKPLFVTNVNGQRNAAIPVSTVRPVYAVTPADVVAITPKKPVHNLYTNIKNIVTPAPYIFSTPSPSTPRSYLLSTIANLKHQISLANKPVLSEHYINKINKYLSY